MTGPVITVDGPSASGKSTVARRVAAAMGCRHVDSGALYRSVTRQVLDAGISPDDPAAVAALLRVLTVDMEAVDGEIVFLFKGQRPGAELRSPAVAASVSLVAALPVVREWVNRALRRTPSLGGIVMDGRDIGSVVFPAAAFKFYLDASPEVRARRRFAEQAGDGAGTGLSGVLDALKRRDALDAGRREAPLAVPAGAQVIDTSALTLDEVVQVIVTRIRGGGESSCRSN
jgi:cytidylate kinase